MNQRIDFSNLGGYPFTQNSLDFMQQSYRNAFGALANFIGNCVILYGVVVDPVANTVSDGWISYNGELMPFLGGGFSSGVVVMETVASLGFQTGGPKQVKFTKVATCGSPATFPFSNLKQPQTLRDVWCKGDIKRVHCDSAYIVANFDGTGLGLNERAGWAIRNGLNNTEDARGRVSIAWDDRTVDPGNGIWDLVYNTPGEKGGVLARVLTMLNIPKHRHMMHANGAFNDDSTHSFPSWYISNKNGSYAGPGGNLFGRAQQPDPDVQTGDAGQDNPAGIDIRQPFIVNIEIEKL